MNYQLKRLNKSLSSLGEDLQEKNREILAELGSYVRDGRSPEERRAISSALRDSLRQRPKPEEIELLRSIWPTLPDRLKVRLIKFSRVYYAIYKDPGFMRLFVTLGAPVAGSSSPKKSKKRGGKRRDKKRVRVT